jgi:hypothetical protein
VQDDLACRLEEKEFEECVENLLHHLIIFLFGAEKVLEHLYEERAGDLLSDVIISTNSGDENHTLEDDVIFSVAIDEVVVQEFYHVGVVDDLLPFV